jgi:hypothetical protein
MRYILFIIIGHLMVSNAALGQYDPEQLTRLLNAWGTSNPQYDYDGNGTVGPEDIAIYLSGTSYAEIGDGFTGSTPQPPSIGTTEDWGYDAKAIARWTSVPHTEYKQPFTVGVFAFHVNGIQRVDFSVNGGAWKSVYEPKYNSTNWQTEYFINIDPSDRADGLIEIRAIAYPNIGVPRVLQGNLTNNGPGQPNQTVFRDGNHGMNAFLNAYGTASNREVYISPNGIDEGGDGTRKNPYKTMGRALRHFRTVQGNADGATIYLLEGLHEITRGNYSSPSCPTIQRFVTIKPAPGVERNQVKIWGAPAGCHGTSLLNVENVTFYNDPVKTNTQFRAGSYTSYFWADRCYAVYEAQNPDGSVADPAFGGGWASGNGVSGSFSGVYITNSFSYNCRNNTRSAHTVINYSAVRPGDTPISGWGLTAKYSITDPVRIGTDHLDGWHFFSSSSSPTVRENAIWYGIYSHALGGHQGMMYEYFNPGTTTLNDVAIVDVELVQGVDTSAGSWWEMNTNHLLIDNVRMPDQPLRFKRPEWATMDPRLQLRNVLIQDYCGSLSDWGDSQPVSGSPEYLIEPNVRVVNYTNPCN